MYDLSDLPNKVTFVIGEPDWCLMALKIINYLTTRILSILFPLARWVTIEIPSISPLKWETAKRTP